MPLTAQGTDERGRVPVQIFGSILAHEIVYQCPLNADCVDKTFFIANYPCVVTDIRYIHQTAGSDAGAVNVQVTKDTGTNAPGAGTDLLLNNAGAGFDCKGTANTVQVGSLVVDPLVRTLAAGDRLALDFAGTVTALVGVVVAVNLLRI